MMHPRSESPRKLPPAAPQRPLDAPASRLRPAPPPPPRVRCFLTSSAGRPSSPAAPSLGAFLLRFGHVGVMWPRVPRRLGASMVLVRAAGYRSRPVDADRKGQQSKWPRPPSFRARGHFGPPPPFATDHSQQRARSGSPSGAQLHAAVSPNRIRRTIDWRRAPTRDRAGAAAIILPVASHR